MAIARPLALASILLVLATGSAERADAASPMALMTTRFAAFIGGAAVTPPDRPIPVVAPMRLETSPPSWRAEPVVASGLPTQGARALGAYLEAGRIELRWEGVAPVPPVTVYRREPAGAWSVVGAVQPDAAGEIVFVDEHVEPGTRYAYALGTGRAGPASFGGLTEVVARGAPPLAVRALRADPGADGAELLVSLPAATYTQVELVSAAGHVTWSHAWTPLSPGPQIVRLRREWVPPPGAYTVRLAQGARLVTGLVTLAR